MQLQDLGRVSCCFLGVEIHEGGFDSSHLAILVALSWDQVVWLREVGSLSTARVGSSEYEKVDGDCAAQNQGRPDEDS